SKGVRPPTWRQGLSGGGETASPAVPPGSPERGRRRRRDPAEAGGQPSGPSPHGREAFETCRLVDWAFALRLIMTYQPGPERPPSRRGESRWRQREAPGALVLRRPF